MRRFSLFFFRLPPPPLPSHVSNPPAPNRVRTCRRSTERQPTRPSPRPPCRRGSAALLLPPAVVTALGRLAVVGVAARRALAAPPLLLALALALLVALPGLALALLVLALALLAALLALFVALLVALLVLGPLGPPLLLRGLVLDLLRQLLDVGAPQPRPLLLTLDDVKVPLPLDDLVRVRVRVGLRLWLRLRLGVGVGFRVGVRDEG